MPGYRERQALRSKDIPPKRAAYLASEFKKTTEGEQLVKQLQEKFYEPTQIKPITPATMLRTDLPDPNCNVKEIYSSVAFALNNLFGGHFFHSHDEVLRLFNKVTNKSYDSYLIELV